MTFNIMSLKLKVGPNFDHNDTKININQTSMKQPTRYIILNIKDKVYLFEINTTDNCEPGYIGLTNNLKDILGVKNEDAVQCTFLDSEKENKIVIQVKTCITDKKVYLSKQDIMIQLKNKYLNKFFTDSVLIIKCLSIDDTQNSTAVPVMFTCEDKYKGIILNGDTKIELKNMENTFTKKDTNEADVEDNRPFSEKILNVDFKKMGIGGLDNEFAQIFRRSFLSRILPDDLSTTLDLKHTKGVLLYGPPGTGKTLIARNIAKLFGTKTKIVNGPEIFNKWFGNSEEKIRELFVEAEEEYAEKGNKSDIHCLIFDEFDSIAGKRDSSGTESKSSIVNQLLCKIDGIEQLNNIFLIGITNRLDKIDSAILRPGRFDIHIKIGLPDIEGREQIFQIHTKKLIKFMSSDINLKHYADLTKNYSGAEIESVVNNTVSLALHETMQQTTGTNGFLSFSNFLIKDVHFLKSIKEVVPAFGKIKNDYNDLIDICRYNEKLFDRLDSFENEKIVLIGESGSGKSALIKYLSKKFIYTKVIKPENILGLDSIRIHSYFEECLNEIKSSNERSLLIIEDLERIIQYHKNGPMFNNFILQALLVFIKECETSTVMSTKLFEHNLIAFELRELFNDVITINKVSTDTEVSMIKKHYSIEKEIEIKCPIGMKELCFYIKKYEKSEKDESESIYKNSQDIV